MENSMEIINFFSEAFPYWDILNIIRPKMLACKRLYVQIASAENTNEDGFEWKFSFWTPIQNI